MAQIPRSNARDPRFRSYRIFFYALYIVVCTAFSVNVIVNVVRSVMVMNPGKRNPSEMTLSVRECLEGAERLWRDLDAQRQSLGSRSLARKVDQEWSQFRVKWMDQFREIESQCALNSHSREPLKDVYQQLDHIQDLYTTHAVQFAGEIGPAIDGFHDAVQAVKKDLSAGTVM